MIIVLLTGASCINLLSSAFQNGSFLPLKYESIPPPLQILNIPTAA
jgi:hypothetical protein